MMDEDEDELTVERKRVERDHLCDCETCRRGGPICPASAGTLIDELAQLRMALRKFKGNQKDGIAELRRYVEGNGFKWCDNESAVFNVTTAIGWMGGALEAQKKLLKKYEFATQSAELRIAIERLRDGFNYGCCPDGWRECDDARLLAQAYLDALATPGQVIHTNQEAR